MSRFRKGRCKNWSQELSGGQEHRHFLLQQQNTNRFTLRSTALARLLRSKSEILYEREVRGIVSEWRMMRASPSTSKTSL
jgi:hypothetical protein